MSNPEEGRRAADPDTADTDAPDGQFHDQDMPTTDGELSDPNPDVGAADRETGPSSGG